MTAVLIRPRRNGGWSDCPNPTKGDYCERCNPSPGAYIMHSVLDMFPALTEYESWGAEQKISPWDAAELEYNSWTFTSSSKTPRP